LNLDAPDTLTATPLSLTDKNLFAYCDNNPVMRVDHGGHFWGSAFDVISLGASIVEVCVNPTDIWAWAGLVGGVLSGNQKLLTYNKIWSPGRRYYGR